MKIALVIGNYNAIGGGAERWTDRHTRRLLDMGIQVHLFARSFNQAPDYAILHTIKPTKRGKIAFAQAAQELLEKFDFDAIHDMGEGWYCDIFMPHHGTRVGGFFNNSTMYSAPVQWIRNNVISKLPRYRQFQKLESQQYESRPGKVWIALSAMVKRHMQTYYGIPNETIRIIYNGVDTDRFEPMFSLDEKRIAKRSIHLKDRVTFLIVAHNFRLKGLDCAIRALARLHAKDQNVQLVVLGNDNRQPYIRLAKKLGVENQVIFAGNVADPQLYYRASDVYIHPTYYDPCSLVLLEALASGLPVVTTTRNGAGEIVDNGQSGFILETPNDYVGFANAMEALLEPRFREKASRAARALALVHTEESNTNQFVKLYQDISNAKRNGEVSNVVRSEQILQKAG